LPSTSTLSPLQPSDFGTIAALARRIWLAHYISIVSKEQIEYMLGGRFTPENLARYVDATDRWFDVLRTDGAVVGYCSHALLAVNEVKLEQLYLLPELHGLGLGKRMMVHIEAHARALGRDTLVLQVNKRNTKAASVYLRGGFEVREEVCVDIGAGYFMDDFILQKRLGGPAPAPHRDRVT
jgi:ribosomal protein S18 acetylase RimI-like enzyme